MEENHDPGKGDRYLVELELKEISNGKSVRFSEYVYRPWGAHTLCTPVGVAWNKSAVINILLTTGNNQGFITSLKTWQEFTTELKMSILM